MAFKTMKDYDEARYKNMFRLINDGDSADVVILYRSDQDVLVADTHYIKSPEYSGYVHCTGRGCPACAKGIRTQPKLFIPVYNINTEKIEFFDRTLKFDAVLQEQVFSKYPNPSEVVFRITRHGAAGSYETKYEFQAVYSNRTPYNEILQQFNAQFPDYYENICRDIDAAEMSKLLNSSESSATPDTSEMPEYVMQPRGGIAQVTPEVAPEAASLDEISNDEDYSEDIPSYVAPASSSLPDYVAPPSRTGDTPSEEVVTIDESQPPKF